MATASKQNPEESWFMTEDEGPDPCDICDGTGLQAGRKCKNCDGTGEERNE